MQNVSATYRRADAGDMILCPYWFLIYVGLEAAQVALLTIRPLSQPTVKLVEVLIKPRTLW